MIKVMIVADVSPLAAHITTVWSRSAMYALLGGDADANAVTVGGARRMLKKFGPAG